MPRLRQAVRWAAISSLAPVLAGCFMSDAPLIDQANAHYPVQRMTIKTSDGETGFLQRVGTSYRFTEPADLAAEDKQVGSVLVHQVADDLFIAQDTDQDGESVYAFIRRQDDKLIIRSDCEGLAARTLEMTGVSPPEDSDGLLRSCRAKTLKSLIDLSQSPALWTGRMTTLQIVSME